MAQAKSSDLRNWSTVGTQGYSNTTQYVSENVEGIYYIQNKFSGLYLDVANGSSNNGANILQYTYKGSTNQQFKIEKQSDGNYAILTRASNCASGLDVYNWSTESGGNINQWNYWGGACQKWVLEPAS